MTVAATMLALGIWGLPLWAGAAAASPVIIHLLNRLRFDRVKWAAMDFLLQSRKRNRRRVELEQLLLLILRVLIIVLLTTAFARIAWGADRGKASAGGGGGPESHFVLLDVSAAMGARSGEGTALDAAKTELKNLIRKLRADDELALVFVGAAPEVVRRPAPLAEGEAESLLERIEDLRPWGVEADFVRAFDELHRRDAAGREFGLMADADPHKKKVVRIVGLFREASWGGVRAAALADAVKAIRTRWSADVIAADAGAGAAPKGNLAIAGVSPHRSLAVFRGSTVPADRDVEFEIRIRNHSEKPTEARLDAWVDGRRTIGPAFTAAGGSVHIETMKLRFVPGARRGTGDVAERGFSEVAFVLADRTTGEPFRDDLPADDRRRMAVQTTDFLRVMLVTGDIGPEDLREFALPLLSAMTPKPREGDAAPAAVHVTHLRSGGSPDQDGFGRLAADDARLRSGVFRDYDLIVLSNVDRVPSALVPELGRFVQAGGSLAVFCGDRVQQAVWNEELYRADLKLLPAALEQPLDVLRTEKRTAGLSPESMRWSHPLLADLQSLPEPLSPTGVQVNRFFRLREDAKPKEEPRAEGGAAKPDAKAEAARAAAADEVEVLARYDDKGVWGGKPGSPAIMQRRVGNGRVLLFTTTPGEPWNDWAVDRQRSASFFIMVQGLLQWAAPERTAAVEAGTTFAALVPAPGLGSGRSDRMGELRSLSLQRRDDPAGRVEWKAVSEFQSVAGDGAAAVRAGDTRHDGMYRILSAGGAPAEMFAVNTAGTAGDLTPIPESARRAMFGEGAVRAAESAAAAEGGGADSVAEGEDPDETRPVFGPRDQYIVQMMLGAMMVLMVLETWLSRKFAHYE